jgi:hypothetical protein
VVIDGGWRDTNLSPHGKLVPHPEKFPNGIKRLADYAYSKELKFGLHNVPGPHDCGGNPIPLIYINIDQSNTKMKSTTIFLYDRKNGIYAQPDEVFPLPFPFLLPRC